MKKIFGILILTAISCSLAYAQPHKRNLEERVETMRVAFITQRIDLSAAQSQAFWPIYNEYRAAQKALRREHRKARRIEEITEAEAEVLLQKHLERSVKEQELKRRYLQEVRTVLSAKQVLQLLNAEKEFKRQLVKRIQERRRKR